MGGSSLLVFHRNYLETTALSVATHSHLIWSTLRMILYPMGQPAHQHLQPCAAPRSPSSAPPTFRSPLQSRHPTRLYPLGGGDVRLVPASACMRVDERSPFPASSNVPLSFWDLAERVSQVSK